MREPCVFARNAYYTMHFENVCDIYYIIFTIKHRAFAYSYMQHALDNVANI